MVLQNLFRDQRNVRSPATGAIIGLESRFITHMDRKESGGPSPRGPAFGQARLMLNVNGREGAVHLFRDTPEVRATTWNRRTDGRRET